MAWTNPRTWTDGELVTASIMNTHVRDNLNVVGPVTKAYKSADTARSSTATSAADPDLVFSIAANETWFVEWQIGINVSATPGIRWTVTAPTGATGAWQTSSAALNYDSTTIAFASDQTSNTAANNKRLLVSAVIVNGANAGTVALAWAQQTSNATATTVKAYSFMVARKV